MQVWTRRPRRRASPRQRRDVVAGSNGVGEEGTPGRLPRVPGAYAVVLRSRPAPRSQVPRPSISAPRSLDGEGHLCAEDLDAFGAVTTHGAKGERLQEHLHICRPLLRQGLDPGRDRSSAAVLRNDLQLLNSLAAYAVNYWESLLLLLGKAALYNM